MQLFIKICKVSYEKEVKITVKIKILQKTITTAMPSVFQSGNFHLKDSSTLHPYEHKIRKEVKFLTLFPCVDRKVLMNNV
jgi:hypothetical protein